MFKKLLIANRGEVAVRIARACRELGISPIGVASEADRGARWLERFDEVQILGPGAPRDSYLDRERIVQAALQTHAAAVHPGWGFLAEDPLFARLCTTNGLTFVGPTPSVMEQMAQKSPAKAAMKAAGLDVIPGSEGRLRDVDEAVAIAAEVGYPVLLKADSGGGGRGMRRCADEAELRVNFAQASAEAESAFGDGRLYLEAYLEGGRHVEFQLLCDSYGHALHLYERECSIQRSHQKLIEESPSPALTPEERDARGRASAAAAAAIGYTGAGTIEFLRRADGSLLFMEMNTRLQVEHPVTEMTTGVDVAAWQIRVAANERLALDQDAIRPQGHAIECRINAEDPSAGFRPTPGRLEAFELPTDHGPGRVRVDTHLEAGETVPPYYDSLIAKVIAHGADRDEAIETMKRTLAAARIEGVATTIPLHLAVLDSDEFRSGEYDTSRVPGFAPTAVQAD